MWVICCQERNRPALSGAVRKAATTAEPSQPSTRRLNNMTNWLPRSLGISAAAIVLAALAYGSVSAQEKTAEAKQPACNSLKEEGACTARDDCSWIAASVDPKT